MFGLKNDVCSSPGTNAANQVLVSSGRAVNLEDEQVGVERIEIGLGRLNETRRQKSGNGAIGDFQIGIGESGGEAPWRGKHSRFVR